MDNSFRYLKSIAGDETEANYPYTAEVTITLHITIYFYFSCYRMGFAVILLLKLL